jgi:hypothetical protein
VLDLRALNRALLARQLLLERSALPALEAIERLGGVQAQAPWPPYYWLWTRLSGFRPDELVKLITSRQAVRIALMRGTIHLVGAADCLAWRPLFQPLLDRTLKTAFGRRLGGVDLAAVAADGRALVEAEPRTMAALGAALAVRHSAEPSALAQVVRATVPLVQPPPRGIWDVGGQATVTSAESWLGRPLDPSPDVTGLVRRGIAAYGPVTVKDLQTWTGLTRLKPVVEALRPELVTFRDEQGRELFDLPSAPRPAPETPAPVRFLPEFENCLISYADRSRIMADAHRARLFTANGIFPSTILVDGFVRGAWKISQGKGSATLRITEWEPVRPADEELLAEEGTRLLAFAAPDAAPVIEFDRFR